MKMNKAMMRRSVHIYGFLLKFYPKSYRQEFGEEMKYVFSQSLKDAYAENGAQAIFTLWARTITDTGKSLITQHVENQKGGGSMNTKRNDIIMQNKIFLWIAFATGFILLIPFLANFPWDETDFIVMGALLFGIGSLFVLAARKVQSHRLIVGIVFLLAFLYLWAELAVGIFTNWGS